MAVLAKTVIVPLCLAAVVTGIVMSLATPWGLLVHDWVATMLAIRCYRP